MPHQTAVVFVAASLVVPASVLATMTGPPSPDLALAVATLAAAGHPVETIEAPPEGRRVASADDLRLLEALTDPLRRAAG